MIQLQTELGYRAAIQRAYKASAEGTLTQEHLTAAEVALDGDLSYAQLRPVAAAIVRRKPENIVQMQEVFEAALVTLILHSAAQVGHVSLLCSCINIFSVQFCDITLQHSAESEPPHRGRSRSCWSRMQ